MYVVVVVKGGCKEVVGRRDTVERVDDVGGENDDELTELKDFFLLNRRVVEM